VHDFLRAMCAVGVARPRDEEASSNKGAPDAPGQMASAMSMGRQ
jgi:hypothetical protein